MSREDLIEEFHQVAERTDIAVGELFERAVQAIYEAWLEPGDVAVDVGAHRGAHLFPLVDAVGPKGKVIAFEPIQKLHARLRKSLKKRGIGNVKLHQLALSYEKGTVEFSFFEKRPAFSGLKRRVTPFDDQEGGLSKVQVKQVRLDSKLPFFRRVSVIKLDIEGGELHALMGAKRCLAKSRPLVVFENGRQASANVYGYSADDFFGFFDRMRMKVYWLSGEPLVPDDWRLNRPCWEFVALPEEKVAFADQLPGLCRKVLAEAAEQSR